MFISHASEDKDAVVRPLAHALQEFGLSVWYDEFELRIGDSLRRKIDWGLAKADLALSCSRSPSWARDGQITNWTAWLPEQ